MFQTDAIPTTPGEEIYSWCTKCRDMRLHKVKAIAEGRSTRVICLVCDGEHNFRGQPPKSKKPKKKSDDSDANPWKELVAEVQEDRIIQYSINGNFDEGEFIKHHRYGLGVVTDVIDSTKIVIAFEDKKRIMVCNK
jgi:hypothetical protein